MVALTATVIGGCGDRGADPYEAGGVIYCEERAEVEASMTAEVREATEGASSGDLSSIGARILGEYLDEWRRVQDAAPSEISTDFAIVVEQWERIAAGDQIAVDDAGVAAEARIVEYEREHCS